MTINHTGHLWYFAQCHNCNALQDGVLFCQVGIDHGKRLKLIGIFPNKVFSSKWFRALLLMWLSMLPTWSDISFCADDSRIWFHASASFRFYVLLQIKIFPYDHIYKRLYNLHSTKGTWQFQESTSNQKAKAQTHDIPLPTCDLALPRDQISHGFLFSNWPLHWLLSIPAPI